MNEQAKRVITQEQADAIEWQVGSVERDYSADDDRAGQIHFESTHGDYKMSIDYVQLPNGEPMMDYESFSQGSPLNFEIEGLTAQDAPDYDDHGEFEYEQRQAWQQQADKADATVRWEDSIPEPSFASRVFNRNAKQTATKAHAPVEVVAPAPRIASVAGEERERSQDQGLGL